MLRQRADRELRDDLQRPLADHVDRVAEAVGHVDERRIAAHDRAEVAGGVGAVHVHDVDGDRRSVAAGRRRGQRSVDVVRARRGARVTCDSSRTPASNRLAEQRRRSTARAAPPACELSGLRRSRCNADEFVGPCATTRHKRGVRLSTRGAPAGLRAALDRLGSPASCRRTPSCPAARLPRSSAASCRRAAGGAACGGAAPRARRARRAPGPSSAPARRAAAPGRAGHARLPPAVPAARRRSTIRPSRAARRGRFALLGGLDSSEVSSAGIEVARPPRRAHTASLPLAQHDAQGAALGGRVYVFGGGSPSELDHIVSFDPRLGRRAARSARSRRRSPTWPSTETGGTAYVVGGFDGTNWFNTILAWRPGSPVRRRRAAAGRASLLRRQRRRWSHPDHRRARPRPGASRRDLSLRSGDRTGASDRQPAAADHARVGGDAAARASISSAVAATSAPADRTDLVDRSAHRRRARSPDGCPQPLSDTASLTDRRRDRRRRRSDARQGTRSRASASWCRRASCGARPRGRRPSPHRPQAP